MPESEPVFWPVRTLLAAYAAGDLSPVEVTRDVLDRISHYDGELHSYLLVTPDLALEQARHAEDVYRHAPADAGPLLGVPISIKDLFDIAGIPTTLGSRVYGQRSAVKDSHPVAVLRAAGSVFTGKSNTAEFGQSATTSNRLGPDCGNPWNPARTAGGSSGGASASVSAGLASASLGSDGGGSIRIPAAMCGLFGLKPTFVGTPKSDSFHAMTEFVCSGPLTRTVDDARVIAPVMLERPLPPRSSTRFRIAWCPNPQGRPVDPGIRAATAAAVQALGHAGHFVDQVDLPLDGWTEAFGPLVLADEWNHRSHLLDGFEHELTDYVRKGIQAGRTVTETDLAAARIMRDDLRARVRGVFDAYDAIVTPTTAAVSFPFRERPTIIDGQTVDPLWGPFPFTAPFNVTGNPGGSVPVGLVDGMPVGLQVIAAHTREDVILDLCEDVEDAVTFPREEMSRRWGRIDSHEVV